MKFDKDTLSSIIKGNNEILDCYLEANAALFNFIDDIYKSIDTDTKHMDRYKIFENNIKKFRNKISNHINIENMYIKHQNKLSIVDSDKKTTLNIILKEGMLKEELYITLKIPLFSVKLRLTLQDYQSDFHKSYITSNQNKITIFENSFEIEHDKEHTNNAEIFISGNSRTKIKLLASSKEINKNPKVDFCIINMNNGEKDFQRCLVRKIYTPPFMGIENFNVKVLENILLSSKNELLEFMKGNDKNFINKLEEYFELYTLHNDVSLEKEVNLCKKAFVEFENILSPEQITCKIMKEQTQYKESLLQRIFRGKK